MGCNFPINLCQNPNGKSWRNWISDNFMTLASPIAPGSTGPNIIFWLAQRDLEAENPHWPSSQNPSSESNKFAGPQVTATSESLNFLLHSYLKTGTKASPLPLKNNQFVGNLRHHIQIIQIIQVCFHALHGCQAGEDLPPSARPEPIMGGKAPEPLRWGTENHGTFHNFIEIYTGGRIFGNWMTWRLEIIFLFNDLKSEIKQTTSKWFQSFNFFQ